MVTGSMAAKQGNVSEQQVQQRILNNYQEIKMALTGPNPSLVIPALDPRAAATKPAILKNGPKIKQSF